VSLGEFAETGRHGLAAVGLVGTAATLFYAFESNAPVLQPTFAQLSIVLASLALVAFGLHLARTETARHVTLVTGTGLGTATAHGLIVAAFYVRFSQPLDSVTHAGTIVAGIVSLGVRLGLVPAHFYRDPDAVTTVDVAGVATDAHETVDLADGETPRRDRLHRRGRTQRPPPGVRELQPEQRRTRRPRTDDLRDVPRRRPGFVIEDDGPGIPERERDRILERGYSNDDGTGLGLAIVAEVAATYDWDLVVAEGRDGGARFQFHLLDDHVSDALASEPLDPERDADDDPRPNVLVST
jgi:hypothetical protein